MTVEAKIKVMANCILIKQKGKKCKQSSLNKITSGIKTISILKCKFISYYF